MYRFVTLLFFTLSLMTLGQTKLQVARIQEKPYCEVSDKQRRFNFTQLSASSEDKVIVDETFGETIRLQLCGPLRKPCNDLYHYSICLERDNVEIGIGKSTPRVTASSGQLKFQFIGDAFDKDKNYTVHVIMRCSYEAGYDSQPELIPHQSDRCIFYMVWKTQAACGEETTVECTAVDNDKRHYNLSSLALREENYEVPVPGEDDSMMILNVCHSVVYDYGASCHPKAGACLRKFDKAQNKTEYTQLGEVKDPLSFENGVLTLRYRSGPICMHSKKPHVETVILFECDHNATSTRPKYEGGADDCVHRFRWKTASACSIESLKNQSSITAETCKVTDPLSNIEYNFRELISQDFHAKSPNGTIYDFQICGSTSASSCPAGAGACQVEKKISMGTANSKLMWTTGGPYLNYTDGDECGNNERRYTQIGFFCGPENSVMGPIVMEEQDCALIIHWNTLLICDRKIKCETKSGEISLVSLIRSSDNYVVDVNDTEFVVNVCRSLVPKPYLTCLHGSAACRVVTQANGQFVDETSLGYPDENPIFDENKHVKLRYTGGSVCPEDKRKTLSSNLTFLCDYSIGKGEPRYEYYRSCTYAFEWRTSVVCEKTDVQWTTGCVIENPRLSQKIDLTSLQEKSTYTVTSRSGDRYNVSLCDNSKPCNGSTICKGDEGYGSPSVATFDYDQNAIVLKYAGGTRCKNGSNSAEVRLICDESAGKGQPKLVEQHRSTAIPCVVTFDWRTKVACIMHSMIEERTGEGPIAEETTENVEKLAEDHAGRNVGIGLFVVFCCVVSLIICQCWSSERRAGLRNRFNALTGRRERCRAQYVKVNATEEARLLLENVEETTQCQTDSDSDDELIDA